MMSLTHSSLHAALATGATLVVAGGRLGRVIRADFDRWHAAQDHKAWPAPALQNWQEWLNLQVAMHPAALGAAELMLSPGQEHALWTRCIEECAVLLDIPDLASAPLARLAQEAWAIQYGYAIDDLAHGVHNVSLEQRAYRAWAHRFRELCEELQVIDQARVLLTLPPTGRGQTTFSVGFSDASPALCRVLPPTFPTRAAPACAHEYLSYLETSDEIAAAVTWALQARAQDSVQVPVIVYADPTLLAPLERALTRATAPLTSVSLLAPMNFRPAALREPSLMANTALRLLNATGEISRPNAVALLNSPYLGLGDTAGNLAGNQEWVARARAAAHVLNTGVEDVPLSTLAAVTRQFGCQNFEAVWPALHLLARDRARRLDLKQWLSRIEQTLTAAGWPGSALLNATEEDELERWRRALDEVAALDLVLPAQSLAQALQWINQAVRRVGGAATPTLDAIEILSLPEAAALAPPQVRVIGLHAGVWPAATDPTPFLSFQAQRLAGVPAAAREQTFARAALIFAAVNNQATALCASFATHVGDVAQQAVQGLDLALSPTPEVARESRPAFPAAFETCEDSSVPVQAAEQIRGGSALLTDQAACPFRAFARHRLHAPAMEIPQLGPDSRLRGDLAHRVLATFWRRYRSQSTVRNLSDTARTAALAEVVTEVLDAIPSPPPGWSLEHARLARLCGEWLAFDLARPSFEVIACEAPRTLHLDALELRLRIDRIDRLADGGTLLIDYKTGGNPTRSQWELPRPDQPQLLAYALTEVAATGIAFGRVRSGKCDIVDLPKNISRATSESAEASLAWHTTRAAWQAELTTLARAFVAGNAEVAPKDALKTCRYCDLQVLCRVHEASLAIPDDEPDE